MYGDLAALRRTVYGEPGNPRMEMYGGPDSPKEDCVRGPGSPKEACVRGPGSPKEDGSICVKSWCFRLTLVIEQEERSLLLNHEGKGFRKLLQQQQQQKNGLK